MIMSKAVFISFEGIDGSGKSTLVDMLADYLKNQGKNVTVLREPGTTPMGLAIRSLVKSEVERSAIAELFLFEASRADMIETVVKPRMAIDDYVITDRYVHSTVAYQGYGNGNNIAIINQLNQLATQGATPDYSFLIDVTLDEAMKHRGVRVETSDTKDKFDDDQHYAKKVYDGYQALVATGELIPIRNNKTLKDALEVILRHLNC